MLTLQRFWICFELLGKNGLTNHAAASAYGFLLSAAPVLLIISFFVSNALAHSPELAAEILVQIGFLSDFFNVGDFFSSFQSQVNPGFVRLISVIPLLWTSRLCAIYIQRGLSVIFPGSQSNPFRAAALTLGLGFIIILFVFVVLLTLVFSSRIISVACLTLAILVCYRIVPVNPQK